MSAEQKQPQQLVQGAACSDAAGEAQGGWGRLPLLPLVASRLQEIAPRALGPARLACRQWAAEMPQGCTKLKVEGEGPVGWEHCFCMCTGGADMVQAAE